MAPITLEVLKSREAEYQLWLKRRILERDASYTPVIGLAGDVPPLRHPKGTTYRRHDRRYLWADAVWCGDISMMWVEEFYGLEITWFETGGEELQEWCNEQFDKAFREVMPSHLHDILEG